MVTFIHTADWQLGAPNQLPACQFPLENLIARAKENNINTIVCAGDIFHKAHPDQQTKDYLLNCVVDHKDITFVFMAGNHDFINKTHDYSSLRYLTILSVFKVLPNVRVLEPGRYFCHTNAIFWALDDWKDLHEVEAPRKNGLPVIALWHGIVPGLNIKDLTLPDVRKKELATKIVESGVHYVALGDIHKQWKIHERCYYPGCLIQTSYADELGALIVKVDQEHIIVKSIDLQIPKKMSFNVQFTDGEDSEEEIINLILAHAPIGNIVKIRFNLPTEIYASVDKQRIKKYLKNHCLLVELDNDPVLAARTRSETDKIATAKNLSQELDIILEAEDFGLEKKELKKLVMEIINHSVVE